MKPNLAPLAPANAARLDELRARPFHSLTVAELRELCRLSEAVTAARHRKRRPWLRAIAAIGLASFAAGFISNI